MNSTLQLIKRTACLACPNCGYRPIFRSLFRVHLECPSCKLPLAGRQGFYLGAMCVNYGITVFTLLPFLLVALLKHWVPLSWGIVLAFVVAVLGPILTYRISWALWLFSYYVFLPNELPCNQAEDILRKQSMKDKLDN